MSQLTKLIRCSCGAKMELRDEGTKYQWYECPQCGRLTVVEKEEKDEGHPDRPV